MFKLFCLLIYDLLHYYTISYVLLYDLLHYYMIYFSLIDIRILEISSHNQYTEIFAIVFFADRNFRRHQNLCAFSSLVRHQKGNSVNNFNVGLKQSIDKQT